MTGMTGDPPFPIMDFQNEFEQELMQNFMEFLLRGIF